MIVIGNQVIEFNLRTMLRRVDISGFKEILAARCRQGDIRWFAMPHAAPWPCRRRMSPRWKAAIW